MQWVVFRAFPISCLRIPAVRGMVERPGLFLVIFAEHFASRSRPNHNK